MPVSNCLKPTLVCTSTTSMESNTLSSIYIVLKMMACIIDALLLVTSLKKVPCPGSIVINRTYCWINDQNMTRTFFMHMRTWTGLCASRHISRLRDRAYALQVAQSPTSLNFNLQSLGLPQRWNSWPLMIPAR